MTLLKELDFGTPVRYAPTMVTLTIDGVRVEVPSGTSIMSAARQHGTQVPKLCATDSLEAFGSCRLCLVEIDGRRLKKAWWFTRRRRDSRPCARA